MQYQYSRACSRDSVADSFNESIKATGRKYTTATAPSGAEASYTRGRGFGETSTVTRYFKVVDYRTALRDSLALNRELLDSIRDGEDLTNWTDVLDSHPYVASMLDRQSGYMSGDQWENGQLERSGLGVWEAAGFMTEYVKPGVRQGRDYVSHMQRFSDAR